MNSISVALLFVSFNLIMCDCYDFILISYLYCVSPCTHTRATVISNKTLTYLLKGLISLAGKVTVGLVESNGSLPLGL